MLEIGTGHQTYSNSSSNSFLGYATCNWDQLELRTVMILNLLRAENVFKLGKS